MKKLILFTLGLLFLSSVKVQAQTDFYPQKAIENFVALKPVEMLTYIKSLDIEIYKFQGVEGVEYDKSTEVVLNLIPSVDQAKFARFKDLFNGDTLGVFFSRHNSYNNVSVDTMLISSEADLWTLAHELSHALIDKNRHSGIAGELTLEEHNFADLANANEDYEEAMSLYRNFGKFLSLDREVQAFQSIKVWTTMMIDLMYAFELEEVKIERALRKVYEAGNSPLDKKSYERSYWYSKRNCKKSTDKIDLAKVVITHYEAIMSPEGKKAIGDEVVNYKKFINSYYEKIHQYCD